MTRSIESWFDVRVDKALEASLSLSRGMLDNMLRDLAAKADRMALSLSTRSPSEHLATLNALREQVAVPEATLYSQRGRVLVFSGGETAGLMPEAPGPEVLRQIRAHQSYQTVESVPDKGLILRVLVAVPVVSLADEARVLQVQPVPAQLTQTPRPAVGIPRMPPDAGGAPPGALALTLTLTLLLALLSAAALAFVLSARCRFPGGEPENTRAVASGTSAGARRGLARETAC
jgi:nitrogen fixation/metabolism regulation signal transduction histidine kinase